MTRRATQDRMIRMAAIAALVVLHVATAAADEPDAPPEPIDIKAEVLLSVDGIPDEDRSWIPSNFHLHRKSGFALTHRVEWNDKPFVFRVQGPVLRKQKAVGLRFKIQF